jgi:hypothetical protein
MAFWISTGDIKERYQPLNVVATFVPVTAPAFGQTDYNAGFRKAVDALALEAQRMGGNGVIWISFSPQWLGAIGFVVFATGTVVQVTPD